MQTFLPFSSYKETAKVLDYRRLGKQRVETWQILNVLLQLKKNPAAKLAWMNHPIVRAWQNYEYQLCKYGIEICKEWVRRGYKDTMLSRFENLLFELAFCWHKNKGNLNNHKPKWLKNEKILKSHRAALLFKDFDYYKQFNWKEKPKLDYVWPVK